MPASAPPTTRSHRFRPSSKRGWAIIDAGSRLVKCGVYAAAAERLSLVGERVFDIQAEGLLSGDEMASAVAELLHSVERLPVGLVLPQSVAISQVVDLEPGGVEDENARLKQGIRALTGLAEGRFVHDSSPLRPNARGENPYWMTVGREKAIAKLIAPWLANGIRIEFVTTSGNALLAAFRESHPSEKEAYLVDLGATQTTMVQLIDGQPAHMASLSWGGEMLAEAIVGVGGAGFDEQEGRLQAENLFTDEACGPPLRRTLDGWLDRLNQQFAEWREEREPAAPADPGARQTVYLYGGYANLNSLMEYLNGQVEGLCFSAGAASPGADEHVLSRGAALIASQLSDHRASLLPDSLARASMRRARANRLQRISLGILLFAVIALGMGIFEMKTRVAGLADANDQAESVLREVEQAESLLRERDQLARWMAPIVDRQVASIEAVETLRLLQEVKQEFDFTVLRFADRRSYFRPSYQASSRRNGPSPEGEAERTYEAESTMGLQAFVVDLMLEGDPAAQMDQLGAIVLRLREESLFSNVDRLLQRPTQDNAPRESALAGETYALMLTLNERRSRGPWRKGSGRDASASASGEEAAP